MEEPKNDTQAVQDFLNALKNHRYERRGIRIPKEPTMCCDTFVDAVDKAIKENKEKEARKEKIRLSHIYGIPDPEIQKRLEEYERNKKH